MPAAELNRSLRRIARDYRAVAVVAGGEAYLKRMRSVIVPE
jgi:hypothetical protein